MTPDQYSKSLLEIEDCPFAVTAAGNSVRDYYHQLYGDVPGFVLTPAAFLDFLDYANLGYKIMRVLEKMQPSDPESLSFWSNHLKRVIVSAPLPLKLRHEIELNVQDLAHGLGRVPEFAVHTIIEGEMPNRHSVRAQGSEGLRRAVLECYASIFDEDTIEHRKTQGFSHLKVTLLVSVRSKAGIELAKFAKGNQR